MNLSASVCSHLSSLDWQRYVFMRASSLRFTRLQASHPFWKIKVLIATTSLIIDLHQTCTQSPKLSKDCFCQKCWIMWNRRRASTGSSPHTDGIFQPWQWSYAGWMMHTPQPTNNHARCWFNSICRLCWLNWPLNFIEEIGAHVWSVQFRASLEARLD